MFGNYYEECTEKIQIKITNRKYMKSNHKVHKPQSCFANSHIIIIIIANFSALLTNDKNECAIVRYHVWYCNKCNTQVSTIKTSHILHQHAEINITFVWIIFSEHRTHTTDYCFVSSQIFKIMLMLMTI